MPGGYDSMLRRYGSSTIGERRDLRPAAELRRGWSGVRCTKHISLGEQHDLVPSTFSD